MVTGLSYPDRQRLSAQTTYQQDGFAATLTLPGPGGAGGAREILPCAALGDMLVLPAEPCR